MNIPKLLANRYGKLDWYFHAYSMPKLSRAHNALKSN